MKRPVRELTGAALDWAVAAALDKQFNEARVVKAMRNEPTTPAWIERENAPGSAPYFHRFSPSTDQLQGGEIIDHEGISTIRCDDDYKVDRKGFTTSKRIPVWAATTGQHGTHSFYEGEHYPDQYEIAEADVVYGSTRLIAAMRAYVIAWVGTTIDLPETLQ